MKQKNERKEPVELVSPIEVTQKSRNKEGMFTILSRETSYNSLIPSSLMSYSKETKPLSQQGMKPVHDIPKLQFTFSNSNIQSVVNSEEQSVQQ